MIPKDKPVRVLDAATLRHALVIASRDLDEQSRTAPVLRSLELRSAAGDMLRMVRDQNAIEALVAALPSGEPDR